MATVLAQTYTDFEYLVIGDHCTDDTAEVVAGFRDSRISWHNLPENTGNQSGVNKIAMEMARGDVVAYLNHDDLWFPDHLETLVLPLVENNLDIVSSLTLSVKPPGINHRRIMGLPNIDDNGSIRVAPMTSNVAHSRNAAAAAGGWIDWRETRKVPTQDFFARLRSLRGAFAIVNDITSLKFHSGDRKDSYRTRQATEQAYYAKQMQADPGFRYREAMKSLAYMRMKVPAPQLPLPEKPKDAPPGWLVEHWRINRGLDPKLAIDARQSVEALEEKDSSVSILENDKALILNPDISPGD